MAERLVKRAKKETIFSKLDFFFLFDLVIDLGSNNKRESGRTECEFQQELLFFF